MIYFQSFVSAMVTTALVVAIARLLLGLVRAEPRNLFPSLCIGAGFLLGHYLMGGLVDGPDMADVVAKSCGSAAGLAVLAAGFYYRANRLKAG